MAYAGKMPSRWAVTQAVKGDLETAPRNAKAFAEFVLERARALEADCAPVLPTQNTELPGRLCALGTRYLRTH